MPFPVFVLRRRSFISGDSREIAALVAVSGDGDTFATGLRQIDAVSANSRLSSPAQIGLTVSGGTITFKVGGPEANVSIRVVGR
jgi:hypothetical protein